MGSGPIPPHERSWRHPSEVAAETHRAVSTEPQSRRGRLAILSAGLLGTVVIISVVAMVTPAVLGPSNDPVDLDLASGTIVGFADLIDTVDADSAPLVTPLASGGLAIAVSDAVRSIVRLTGRLHRQILDADPPPEIPVRLPDGQLVRAHLLDLGHDGAPAVVRLLNVADADGYPVAAAPPRSASVVTVMAERPITIRYHEFPGPDPGRIVSGTAVLDRHGHLVGLCALAPGDDPTPDSIRLIPVTIADVGLDASAPAP